MTTPLVLPSDLGTYLGMPPASIDQDRATQILALAQSLCLAIVTPLPAGAEAVILDVAARAWSNPTNAQSEVMGPYSTSFGAVSGGLWLTRQNKATLRGLSGGGGVFTIDTLPADYVPPLPWWDTNVTADGCWW